MVALQSSWCSSLSRVSIFTAALPWARSENSSSLEASDLQMSQLGCSLKHQKANGLNVFPELCFLNPTSLPITKKSPFFSSDESEEEEDHRKKFKIKIKPLLADRVVSAPTVDELKASIGNISLSPSPVVSQPDITALVLPAFIISHLCLLLPSILVCVCGTTSSPHRFCCIYCFVCMLRMCQMYSNQLTAVCTTPK